MEGPMLEVRMTKVEIAAVAVMARNFVANADDVREAIDFARPVLQRCANTSTQAIDRRLFVEEMLREAMRMRCAA
jgi:hypothetical protein